MTNVIDITDYQVSAIARDFIAEHGIDEFREFQEALKAYLELCEDAGLVPDDIMAKYSRR
jgi:hypothetical protein